MNPQDETNHIFYKTWKDKGNNIGIQCNWCDQTFWTGKELPSQVLTDEKQPQLGTTECKNCQAIKKSNLLETENRTHARESTDEETGLLLCHHPSSQP